MQAIWSHKVGNQLFFELYKLPIDYPKPEDAETSFEVHHIAPSAGPSNVVDDGLIHNRIFSK